ncbi:MAG: nicotinate-nucleotide--dimethylbenzimidazole phosphoribosyltransferase [Dehalococcoidia bacterium]|nr:MAG: nicotinate-nucleotide--dimethylbenzimidazole phosphoribosyltransferase [Dehalococcoidia bacterium]
MRSLEQVIREIKPPDEGAMAVARARQDTLTKPLGSLGRLEELSVKVAGIKGEPMPGLSRKAIVTMAADHGVAAEGVSAYPQEVTAQMVQNFLRSGAGINVLATLVGAKVIVVDMGVASAMEPHPALVSRKIAYGTQNMARGPAMTREQAINSVEVGVEIAEKEVEKGLDIIGTGDMGIGNTTPSSAITAVFTGEPVAKVTGWGTGIDDRQLAQKVKVIERALRANQPDPNDPIDVLSKVGGFEIGGLSGVILGAAAHRIPIVIDGFISGAAALIAAGLSPIVRDYLIASHISVEIGHQAILDYLGLRPLLALELRLGEGTGAALGIFLVEAAAKVLTDMATFSEAGVSQAEVGKD